MRGLGAALALTSLLSAAHAHAEPSTQACLDASEAGERRRDAGAYTEARELFTTCAAASCPEPVRSSCGKWLALLVESMPSVVVIARDAEDNDLSTADLAIDGGPPHSMTGRAVPLDPGRHTVVVRAPGYETAEQELLVHVNEKNRVLRVVMRRVPSRITTKPAAPPTERAPAKLPIMEIGLGSVAVVGAALSLVLGLGARSDLADIRSSPCAATGSCESRELDALRTRFVIADVSLGVGLVAGALLAWRLLSPSTRAATAR